MIQKIKSLRNNKKLLSNILSLTVLQGANYILPLITLPYLVMTLGVEKFGILAFAQAVVMYFNFLVDYGFGLSATRAIATNSHNPKRVSEIFISVMLIKAVLFALSLALLSSLIFAFDRIGGEWVVYMFTFAMLIGNILFPVWYFQGIEEMKYITYINILSKLIFTVAIFVFVHSPADYELVPALNSIGIIIGGAIAFIMAARRLEFHMPSRLQIKETFRESTTLFVSNASITLFTASNTLILGLFASNAVVGIYAAIERLMMAVKYLYAPLYQGLFPWLSKKERSSAIKFIGSFLPIIGGFGLILSVFIATFAHPILELIYSDPLINEHYDLLQVYGSIAFLSGTNMLFSYLFLNAIREYNARMRILLTTGLFNVAASLTLTALYGVHGLVYAVASTEALLLILGYLKFREIRKETL